MCAPSACYSLLYLMYAELKHDVAPTKLNHCAFISFGVCVRVCVCACVRVRVRVRVCLCVCDRCSHLFAA